MKKIIFPLLLVATVGLLLTAFTLPAKQTENLRGAWIRKANTGEVLLQFMDGYFTHTAFDKTSRKFNFTRGGTYSSNNGELKVNIEFDTRDPEGVGKSFVYKTSVSGNTLTTEFEGRSFQWTQVDNGANAAHGVWQITGRMQGDNFVPMNPGPRKTLKVLTSTRFQWIAINPETKGFFGTGGGTYTFKDGKYTETIEFFSRDSSRVGAALTFDGNVENSTKWTHKGLSSRGEPIHEVWERKNPKD